MAQKDVEMHNLVDDGLLALGKAASSVRARARGAEYPRAAP